MLNSLRDRFLGGCTPGGGFNFSSDFVVFMGATMNYRFCPIPQPDPQTISAINFINPQQECHHE